MFSAAAIQKTTLGLAGGAAMVFGFMAPSQAALVTFNLAGGTGTNLNSYSFTSGGVGLTVSTAVSPTTPVSPQGFVSYTNPGICLFANATTASRCGVPATGGTFPASYNNLAFSFNSDVLLRSFNVSQTIAGTANFGSLNVLSNNASIGTSAPIIGNNTAINRVNFTNPILVKANTPVVFNTASGLTNSAFRISDLVVDTVPPVDAPGPLPMLGAAAAFRASRRLRRRLSNKTVKA